MLLALCLLLLLPYAYAATCLQTCFELVGIDGGNVPVGSTQTLKVTSPAGHVDGDYLMMNTQPAWTGTNTWFQYLPIGETTSTYALDFSSLHVAGSQAELGTTVYLFLVSGSSITSSIHFTMVAAATLQPTPAVVPTTDFKTFTAAPTVEQMGNPGTGFTELTSSKSSSLSTPSGLINARNAEFRVYWWSIELDNGEANADHLPEAMLRKLRTALQAFASNGKQVFIRFWYTEGNDPAITRIVGHIKQLSVVLREYRAVVAGINAGMLGNWGEWHTSKKYADINAIVDQYATVALMPDATKAKALPYQQVVNEWLTQLPPLPVQVRRGQQKRVLFVEEEHANRVQHHIDCFMSDDSDVGTFTGPGQQVVTYGTKKYTLLGTEQRNWLKQDSLRNPIMGETCSGSKPRFGCEAALEELSAYHFSSINTAFYVPFITSWKEGGCFNQIASTLGYRWELVSLQVNNTGVELNVRNTGFAASAMDKIVHLVLVQGTTVHRVRLDNVEGWIGTQSWAPNGSTQRISLRFALSSRLPSTAVTYAVRLEISESVCVDETLAGCASPNLKTRLANSQVTFTSDGMNDLAMFVVLGGDAEIITSQKPTTKPTLLPTSQKPTTMPTKMPSSMPTKKPTDVPTTKPSKSPTLAPTKKPTALKPSKSPTPAPTKKPTKLPTVKPSKKPTLSPTAKPSKSPSPAPTKKPSKPTSFKPSKSPSPAPTKKPTKTPTAKPTKKTAVA